MLKKNDVIELNITAMTSEGAGIGKHEGMAVFVRGTAIGDIARVLIIKSAKNYAVGKLEQILAPSPDRIENDCDAFPRCGGCVYRHISYNAECDIKHQRVADCLSRIGGVDIMPQPTEFGFDNHYRNKAQYPVSADDNGIHIGFYANHSHRIIDCRSCALQPKAFADIVKTVEQFIIQNNISVYNESTKKGLVRHIYIRRGAVTGEIMVCIVINGKSLPKSEKLTQMLCASVKGLKTVVLNINTADTNVILSTKCINIYGDGYISDILCGVKVRLSALSFYQVNHNMAERLYKKAAEFAGGGKTLVDLYCGAGTISLSMANLFENIVGVEIIPEAVEDAKFNAKENGISNARFLCADAYEAAKQLDDEGLRPDVVIVDPPRKGLEAGLPRHIALNMAPERVVYVSCDPATLARDVKEFEENGYKLVEAVPFDLFPRTAHVETVVLLSKKWQRVYGDENGKT